MSNPLKAWAYDAFLFGALDAIITLTIWGFIV